MDETTQNKPVAVFQDLKCCGSDTKTDGSQQSLQQLSIPMAAPPDDDAPCCGPKPGPPSSRQGLGKLDIDLNSTATV